MVTLNMSMLKASCKLFIVCCLTTVAGCDRDIVEPNKAKNPIMGPTEINAFLDRLFMEKIQQSPQSMAYLGMRDRYNEWDDISDQA